MRHARLIAGALGTLGALALLVGAGVASAQAPAAAGGAEKTGKDLVLRGDARCTRCHDQEDSPGLLAIGKTRHGTTADLRTPTCTSCHGESDRHINKPPDATVRPLPDVTFGKHSKTPTTERAAVCLTCHQGGNREAWQFSAHGTRELACTNCHRIHTAHDLVRNPDTQPKVCFTCHKEQRTQINKPSHHPIPEGKMACANCHNVHGNNPKQLVKNSVNEVCFTCHMEKRGPFLHNHEPVTENCAICHQPHGSTISPMLKMRPPFLCQGCHGSSGHPQQAAGLPTGRTTGSPFSITGTVGRGCLNCHTNIHGSNNTLNSGRGERFLR
jgi:DmsE family decaheme c-type cytochrome